MRPSARRILTPRDMPGPIDLRTQRPWPKCARCDGHGLLKLEGRRCPKCKGMGLIRPRNWDGLRVVFAAAFLFAMFAYAVRCSP